MAANSLLLLGIFVAFLLLVTTKDAAGARDPQLTKANESQEKNLKYADGPNLDDERGYRAGYAGGYIGSGYDAGFSFGYGGGVPFGFVPGYIPFFGGGYDGLGFGGQPLYAR